MCKPIYLLITRCYMFIILVENAHLFAINAIVYSIGSSVILLWPLDRVPYDACTVSNAFIKIHSSFHNMTRRIDTVESHPMWRCCFLFACPIDI